MPLAGPISGWFMVGAVAWVLTQIEPPTTLGDYAGPALLWCAAAAMAFFVAMFTRQYLRDRRRSTQ